MKAHDMFPSSETYVADGPGIEECMDPTTAPQKMLTLDLATQDPSMEVLQAWTIPSPATPDPQPTYMDLSSMETDSQTDSHASTMGDARPASPRTRTWGNLQDGKFQTEGIGNLTVNLLGKAVKRGNLFEVERDHSFKPEILLVSDTKDLMGQATSANVLLSLVRSHPDAKGKPIMACQEHDLKDGHVLQMSDNSLGPYGTGQYIDLTDACSGKFVKCLYLKDLPIENGNKILLPDIKSVCYNTKCSGPKHESMWQLVVQCEHENGSITGRTSINFKSVAHIRPEGYWKRQRKSPNTPGKRMKMQKKTKKTIHGKFTKSINIPLTASSPEALAEKERKLLISAQKIEAGE